MVGGRIIRHYVNMPSRQWDIKSGDQDHSWEIVIVSVM